MKKSKDTSARPLLSFFGGAASLSLAAVTVKLFGLLYKLPMARVIGDEGMGYVNTAYTVYSFFYLLATAGVPKAISMMTAECRARGDGAEERRILQVALRTFFAAGVVGFALLFFFADALSLRIGNQNAAQTMRAVAPSVLFVAVGGVLRGALAGNGRLLPIALSELISGAAKPAFGLLFALLCVRRGLPLPTVSACSTLGITLGSFFATVLLVFFYAADIRQKEENADNNTGQNKKEGESVLKRILHVALPVTASSAVMSLSSLADLALINRRLVSIGYTEVEATALYGNYTTLALPMFHLIAAVIAPISVAALPLLTARRAVGDEGGLQRLIATTLSAVAFISVPSAMMLMLLGEPILTLLFPSASARVAAPLLVALAPAAVFMSLLTAVNTALEAMGCVRAPLFSMGLGAAVKIAVGYFMIGDARFGILGAPVGTCLSYIAGLFLSLLLFRRRGGEVSSLLGALLRPTVFALAASLGALSVYRLLLPLLPTVLATPISLIFGGGLYLVSFVIFGEKEILTKKIWQNTQNV